MNLTTKARNLRKNQTDVEQILWQQLRSRQLLNCKFRRQMPFAPYIVDFICLDHHLIIELDGSQHQEQKAYLARHPRYISSWDIHVQRLIPLGRLN
jgi:crossover junction endodeoxyribonuclease RuvC